VASANVELVRAIFADWERGHFSSLDWADPEIEFVIADTPDARKWTGLAGMSEGFLDYVGAWAGYGVTAEGYLEPQDGRVLALVRLSGRGKTSGLDLGQIGPHAANVFDIRDDKVTRLVLYVDRDRALADLSLPPDTDARRP
jgi:ketosteroid isomerase-like protein